MIEFNWELPQVLSGIKKGLLNQQAAKFLRPHSAIWGDTAEDFTTIADCIMTLLPSAHIQRHFFSVCLASYLLDPRKAPDSVPTWIQKIAPISGIIGCDVSLEALCTWRWDRAAFPVLDEYENGRNDTIYYALVGSSKTGRPSLFPSWISDVLNADAIDAVTIAAELSGKAHTDNHFFFWPFINPKKPTHDRSLGLPVYLSFLSLAAEQPIPPIIATGEINRLGELCIVQGVQHKCNKTFEKKYKVFIYPEDGSRLEQQREYKPVGIATLAEAEQEWGVRNSVHNSKQYKLDRPISLVNYHESTKEDSPPQISTEAIVELPKLTKNQTEALNAIISFINSPTDCFILKGGAGTGKTTLLKVLLHTLKEENRACMCLAPTGRAARILGNKTEYPASTIHSAIYSFTDLEVFEDAEAINDPGTRIHFELKTDDPGENIFIVDESSMIADVESEQDDVRFGSGRLLADFIEYTRIARPGRGPEKSKIIFVGDQCQLLPVKQDISPALSPAYLNSNHGLTCTEFEIKDVVRQKSDSMILVKAGMLRNRIEEGVFNMFDLSSATDEIVEMASREAVSLVAESGNKAVLITYRNQQALELNREVRALLWGNENLPVQEKDCLLVNKNAIKHRLFNGDLVKVTKVSEQVETRTVLLRNFSPIKLTFRSIQVAYRSFDNKPVFIDCLILENILNSPERALSPIEQRALFIDFLKRNPNLKVGTAEFRNALMHDDYFNALQVKYGYAITCHKAQGGEWDTAAVFFGDSRGTKNESFFRWAYTAITRAKKKLCTIDAPRFTPFSSLIQDDYIESRSKNEIVITSALDDPDFLRFSFPSDKQFLFDTFVKFRNIWTDAGIAVIDVRHLQYQEQLTVRRDNATATVQYHYKGNGSMASAGPSVAPGGGELGDEALRLASQVFADSAPSENIVRPQFLLDLEELVRSALADTGIELCKVSSRPYRERYEFVYRGQSIGLDFSYNGKQQCTRLQQVGGDTPSGGEVKGIIMSALGGS